MSRLLASWRSAIIMRVTQLEVFRPHQSVERESGSRKNFVELAVRRSTCHSSYTQGAYISAARIEMLSC